jgi:hexosaminidase
VALLVDLVAPVHNHADNRVGMALLKGKKAAPQEFNELADAASPDSLVARRFELDAERFVQGDRSRAAALKASLASSRDNRDRFAAVANGVPQLEAALPISDAVAALAAMGLDVIAAVESGRAPGADWHGRAKELLDRQAAARKRLGRHAPGRHHRAAPGRPSHQHHAGRTQAFGCCGEPSAIT